MATLIENIGVLATAKGKCAQGGKEQGAITTLHNCFLLIEGEMIAQVGSNAQAKPHADKVLDAQNCLVTAGLVDPHTHLVFGGSREHELALKLKGVSYLEILAQGGGILSTVRATRSASKEELFSKAGAVLDRMLKQGVTTVEAKSGYGLTLADEIKMLEVVQDLNAAHKVDLVATFMGAHAVPPEYKEERSSYLKLLLTHMLPHVAKEKLAEFVDVFCEEGVFTPEETKQILQEGKKLGLGLKCHTDEIVALGGTEVAASLGALSCEHLIKATPQGIRALAKNGTIACLLPGTSFYLNSTYAPAREMLDEGVAVSFGSDFNPGSNPSNSLQLAMHIGCYKYRLTPEECLMAVTLNSAAALNRADSVGTLEEGKLADLVMWDAPNLDYLFYSYGDNLAKTIVKRGEVV